MDWTRDGKGVDLSIVNRKENDLRMTAYGVNLAVWRIGMDDPKTEEVSSEQQTGLHIHGVGKI